MNKFDITRLLLIVGSFWLTLGALTLILPSVTYIKIVQYSGFALLLDGLLWLSLCFASDSDKGERGWRMLESSVDIAFSIFLLLDPIFALLIFPFVVIPWMAVKGLLKMISSIALSHHLHGWSGDFIAGILLVLFSMIMPRADFSINISIGIIGLTLGLLYFYDYFRAPEHRHLPYKH